MLRKQAYWTILAGGIGGYLYGSAYYDFHAGWQRGIDTVGVTQLAHWKFFFENIPWYDLLPIRHIFHHLRLWCESQIPNLFQRYFLRMTPGDLQTDGYATAGFTPNGEIGVVYLHERATIKVNMSIFRAPVSAHWFDPAIGKYREIDGSPFPNIAEKGLCFTPQ